MWQQNCRSHPRLPGLGPSKWGAATGGGPGGEEQQQIWARGKAAAIVLMSWRKWWEFVRGGRALEFQKGSKVSLLQAAKARSLGRGWGRVLATLPSGTQNKLPQAPGPRKGEGLG